MNKHFELPASLPLPRDADTGLSGSECGADSSISQWINLRKAGHIIRLDRPDHAADAEVPAFVAGDRQIEARDIYKSYRKGSVEVPVLQGLSIAVREGEFLAIVGQSGSGKSTLLHLLGTLDAPDQGEIHFEGRRIDNLPRPERDRLRNQRFGMIFQFYHLLPELTALENVLSPLMIAEGVWSYLRNRRRHRENALHLLSLVGLSHRLKHKPRAFGRRNAAGGHRPGPGGQSHPLAGRRTDRKSRPIDRPRNSTSFANLERAC
jgi:predicted ABC-type transport system involved in lysophospholipase L1 biosynthesis ATPase subunit